MPNLMLMLMPTSPSPLLNAQRPLIEGPCILAQGITNEDAM